MVIWADPEQQFLGRFGDESDPEKKRKVIGNTFIEVFDVESRKLNEIKLQSLCYFASPCLFD